jgi:hypothetical protein
MAHISEQLRRQVAERADHRCEYCRCLYFPGNDRKLRRASSVYLSW